MLKIKLEWKNIYSGEQGASAIEFAILTPIFVVLALACIELGMYFVKEEITNSAISSISQAIQRDPTLSNGQLKQLAQSYGSGLIKFETGGNYICGRAYTTQAQAQSAAPCTDTNFFVSNPGPAGTPYYIVISSSLAKSSITPLGNFVSQAKNMQVSGNSGAVPVGNLVPPKCDGLGQYLQWDGTKFTCIDGPPSCNAPGDALQWNGTKFICVNLTPTNCSHPWQKLEYTGSSFTCVPVPYVIAGGEAKPGSNNSGAAAGSYWDDDNSSTPWLYGTHNYYTLCAKNIQFTIPKGLPSGQIIAAGELYYPGVVGAWHSWVISFVNFNAPLTGGVGSTDICEANGGNWNHDSPIMVGAEHVSWTVTFIPN